MPGINKLKVSLTLMNTVVLIGLSVFIAVALYVTMNIDMEASVSSNLQIYCSQLANNISYLERVRDGSTVTQETKDGYDEFRNTLTGNDVAFVIWDSDFNVLDQSDDKPLSQEQLLALVNRYFSGNRERYMVNDYESDNLSLKICTYTTVSADGKLSTVQVMKHMNAERGVMQDSVSMIFWVVLAGALLSIWCGSLLSGRALRPIKQNMQRQQEFLADASHELRTPIAVIQTNLEVVRACDNETVDSQRTWLDNAYDESKRMRQIVEDLMFLARADAGEQHSENVPVDMTYLLMEVSERFIPLAAKKNITLYNQADAEELLVIGDEKQLTQVLVILIDNAIKYSPENTTIVVSIERVNDGIAIAVKDQGIGIAQEDQQKIFERFYRVDKVRSRSEGGTGLGLSIAWWIVNRHKGTIHVDSEEGFGTTMTVTLPEAPKQLPTTDHIE